LARGPLARGPFARDSEDIQVLALKTCFPDEYTELHKFIPIEPEFYRDNPYTMIGQSGCWILDAGYWMLDAGYWMLDTGYWMLDTGYWMLEQGILSFYLKGKAKRTIDQVSRIQFLGFKSQNLQPELNNG